ncbi:uncharacterized protein LOC113350392 isoform X1 [Papaver somniferum]|uniref:uncharacterized protein LOC113350392 isoform X1 n=1 Tax=Papaver somniferum TaxID=3469 RepID=UPI000E6F8C4E|nr:uncharacterized protein LOC113350392 isoform X1 [Papaver somniferum]
MERLFEVSQKGYVDSLRKLLLEVPSLTLDEVFTSFCRTPVHIAVMCGHVSFVKEVLIFKPELALKADSQGLTPLHLASARLHLGLVKVLLEANADACMVQDQYGRTPLHLAVMKGRVKATKTMKMLIQERPEAIHLRNAHKETILHFCVKNNGTVEALALLVEYLAGEQPGNPDYSISVNSKDVDGNTILHVAAKAGNMKIVKFLVDSEIVRIDINAFNNNGLKALDILPQNNKNELEIGRFYYYIPRESKKKRNDRQGQKERMDVLMVVATLIAGIAFQAASSPPGGLWQQDTMVNSNLEPHTFTLYLSNMLRSHRMSNDLDGLASFTKMNGGGRKRHSLNIAVELNSTISNYTTDMSTQFVWDLLQANSDYLNRSLTYSEGVILEEENYRYIISNYHNSSGSDFFPYLIMYAGTSILAYISPSSYILYMVTNVVAFLVSVTIILLVISGVMNDTSVAQVRLLVVLMCISIGCIIAGYRSVFIALTPDFLKDPTRTSLYVFLGLWCIFGTIFFIWSLISNIRTMPKYLIVGVQRYLKLVFSFDARDVGKVIIFICGLFVFLFLFLYKFSL